MRAAVSTGRSTARASRPGGKVPSQRASKGVRSAKNAVATDAAPTRSPYDSGAQTRRTRSWRAPTTNPNSLLSSLTTIRDRARAAVRNNGFPKGIIDTLVTEMIGTGITPLPLSSDEAFKATVKQLWSDWTDVSDADGLLDFYGQQTQATRCWLEAGEVFVRMRPRLASDGLPVPLQLQVLEPEMCPHTHETVLANGNRVRAGIEFNGIGQRVAYWFYRSRPGQIDDIVSSDLRRVPASLVIHMYDPLRAGQLRGLPVLTAALVLLYELDKTSDGVLVRQAIANMFAGFVTTEASSDDIDIDPLTGQERVKDDEDRPLVALEAGTIQELDAGMKVEFSKPPDPPLGYGDFMKQHLRGACLAAGVPYEVAIDDLSGLNDRTMRVLLNKFRRRIMASQHQVVAHQLCRRVWVEWMDRAFLADALPIPVAYVENPTPYARVAWQPQGWAYINPVQDILAKREAVRDGFSTRTAEVAEQGEDAALIDLQNAEDNARADKLGLVYDSNPKQVSAAGLTQARPAGSEIPGEGATA